MIMNQLLVDWFTKSLLSPFSRDVSMGSVITEDKEINHSQYLDLVNSQSNTLYNLIHYTPHPSKYPSKTSLKSHADGMVGSVTNTKTAPTQTFEMNVVHSTSSKKPEGKKKKKGKSKKSSNQ
jgi:hypothetical protein